VSNARNHTGRLALGALGVVYGDIGTSPLYALRECFNGPHGMPVAPEHVLGVLSLVLWAIIIVVVVKYLGFVLRADNDGEGGILALFALVGPADPSSLRRRRVALLLLGLFGASLLYGDGVITPAISVLGAVEGLEVATTALRPLVVPLTIGILLALFFAQRFGTAKVGNIFGPTTLVWFVWIAALGLPAIVRRPEVLHAIDPRHAVGMLHHGGARGFFLLGSVFLVVTGGEALYADMGHFGRRPIRLAWFTVAMPCLVLNYFGQGALLIEDVASAANPFYRLATGWRLYPTVVIATMAAVIASQAMISGAFSLTHQAVQLGYWPRVTVVHTSGEQEGQIYIPEINSALMVGCIAVVFGFEESSRLAAAYGIAVTGTMGITSVLFYAVARERWRWSRRRAGALVALFLVVDLAFFASNAIKIRQGGWLPLGIGLVVFAMMTTWRRGRSELARLFSEASVSDELFLADVETTRPYRVPGTAVFMTSNQGGIPGVLLHHFKHNKVLHQQVILLSMTTERVPIVHGKERMAVLDLGHGFHRVIARYGFMQQPNAMMVLRRCQQAGLKVDPDATSFYLGRETLLTSGKSEMARWRKQLFAFLSRNSRTATSFFGLPPNRVVEIGAQIEL
jgi:KUP system potassium uptake protein